MSQTHTPGEWRMESFQHGQHGYSAEVRCGETAICECYGLGSFAHGNAERIVLCCNAHDDLVAAAKAILEARRKGELHYAEVEFGRLRDALAKAGEK